MTTTALRCSLMTLIFAASPAWLLSAEPKQFLNVEYGRVGDKALLLDLKIPAATTPGPYPLVVWIHGGGWRAGTKKGYGRAAELVDAGYAVASVEYRLSTEAISPAQIHDCKAAIRWLRAHAAEYNINPDQIGVWGSSAGGHLVALLGTSGGVAELEGTIGDHLNVSSRVQAVCDHCGPSDLVRMATTPGFERRQGPNDSMAVLLGGPVLEHQEAARLISPVTYINAEDPPFLIVHGEQDEAVPVDQSRHLHARLQEGGVSSRLRLIPDKGHSLGKPKDPVLLNEAREFFDEVFGRQSAPQQAPTP
ncbi:alpha/beta hydrolase fold domain-containing protein [Planctomicrobium sp. SH664]|uniref:alpha/beta hydrolase fold domain-containing protein n=1 Tax=Planctomicrobium sp. SH664 TaxID=3448125 RepID=UPI003F5BCE82